jgi:hypothetical protein
MKKVVRKSIIIILLFVCPSAFSVQKATRKFDIKVTIKDDVLEKVEKSCPEEVHVYEIQPGDPGLWMERFTGMLSIKGKTKETKELLFVKEGNRYLEIRKVSNCAFYGDMARLWKEQPTPEKTQFNVPSNAEAEKLTRNWLKKLGFSYEDMRDLEISVSDEKFEITIPEKKEEPISIVVGKNVKVRRRINKLLVYGPGSKIKIYIGSDGEVNGLMAVWRQILPSSGVLGHKRVLENPKSMKVKPIKASEAFEALKKNPLDHLPLALVDQIDINEVRFGYYSRSATEHQKYLQPVYVFYGTAHANLPNGKRVSVPYEQYVIALEKPFESIWPETYEFKPEPRREGEVPKRGKDVDEKGG